MENFIIVYSALSIFTIMIVIPSQCISCFKSRTIHSSDICLLQVSTILTFRCLYDHRVFNNVNETFDGCIQFRDRVKVGRSCKLKKFGSLHWRICLINIFDIRKDMTVLNTTSMQNSKIIKHQSHQYEQKAICNGCKIASAVFSQTFQIHHGIMTLIRQQIDY